MQPPLRGKSKMPKNIVKLVSLLIIALTLLLFVATAIATLALGLAYSASLPGVVKVGVVALLALAVIVEVTLYRRWRRRAAQSRAARSVEDVTELLDFCDDMMESLDVPRLETAQRDVLRGALESFLCHDDDDGGR
jgi:pilus assembly protein TadC